MSKDRLNMVIESELKADVTALGKKRGLCLSSIVAFLIAREVNEAKKTGEID